MKKETIIELISLALENKSENQSSNPVPFEAGNSYFIRTVTYHLVGRVKSICGNFLVLEDAAWVADSGRFTQAINYGKLSEIEPVKVSVFVNINSIIDSFEWKHNLPLIQK